MIALNVMIGIFPYCAFKDLRKTLWFEKNGIRTEGEIIILRYNRGGMIPTFGYTTEDGTYFKQEVGDIYSTGRVKLHEKFTLIYNPEDPTEICVEKYSLRANITNFALFALLEAGILGATIYLIVALFPSY